MYEQTATYQQTETAVTGFMWKVYSWMTAALFLTAATAWYVAGNPTLVKTILMNQGLFFGLIIGELVLVFVLVGLIYKMSAMAASTAFIAYSIINGITLSVILLAYTGESIALTFGVTACTYGAMSIYGFTTKRDLSSLGSMAVMGLFGIIIASIANFFFKSSALYWFITYAGGTDFCRIDRLRHSETKKYCYACECGQ